MSGEGGAGADPNANSGGTGGGDPKNESVPKAELQRVLDDMHKFKKTAGDLEKERNDLKTRLEALENDAKTKQGDFKGLYEQTKSQLDEIKADRDKLKQGLVLTQKHSAVQAELTKKGFKPEFFPLLDKESFDDVAFEVTNTGRYLVTGADLFVDQYKKKYPSAFAAGNPPVFNGGGGAGGGGDSDMTIDKLNAIERECKKKGDMKPYYDAFNKYREAKSKK